MENNQSSAEYLVSIMLKAGVKKEKIFEVSRNMAFLFGVKSEWDAELLAIEYFDKCKNEQES